MADSQTVHPHLSGVPARVRSEDDFELAVVGRIPEGLAGAYYRNGPNPQFDPETGEMTWFGYFAGPERFSNLVDYGVTDKTGKVTRRDRFAAPYASVIHDFIVTRNYVVFPVQPLTGDLGRLMKGGPVWAWEPERGGFVGVMRRDAGVDSIRWFEMEPRFMMHTMNAWEDGRTIHCELMEFPHAPVFPNADGSPPRDAEARLTRWSIDLDGGTNQLKRETIDDLNSEMPRFDERFAGRAYRHGWYMASVGAKELGFNAMVHIDLKTGRREMRVLGAGDTTDEPVFVPRSASAAEGDGYVLALVYRAEANASELLILEARDVAGEPVAVLKVPRRVPSGFHGSFVSKASHD